MRNELNRMVQGVTDPAKKKVSSVSGIQRNLDAARLFHSAPASRGFATASRASLAGPACVSNTQNVSERHAGCWHGAV